ncbi:MAG: Branched-chain amino acid aminotransferase [Cytophagales bacterium]|jgi:branched-chain amino acid aminotransferase|nr:branched-chain amino acid aminotransferase [Bacteroidota bacterium]MBS1980906.1 branched-chain amino acid aminotransferase [Bacteroidota bacterium]WHZ08257.1 MAG: Branched-chain amino acid aminotransferase [Cytophagales bacterium]
MTLTESISIERVKKSRLSTIDFSNLGFGNHISDHMLVADYKDGAWHEPKIIPFGDMMMSPAMLSLHYGQTIFEGMKAFKNKNGEIIVFRPQRHHQRMNKSLERMCMPTLSEEYFLNSLSALIEVDSDWVPTAEGSSLYLRPFVFAFEAKLGVKIADEYKFMIITSPVGPYFAKPVKLKVEEEYVRAAEGGTGFAKCAGNYGGAFYPTLIAQKQGFDQVLWTDAKEHKYIDESGAMNVMFVLNGKLVTPKLTTSLLDGVTRDSILTLSSSLGLEKEERKVSVAEIEEGFKKGTLTEAFGVGTAAVVSTIASISIHGKNYELPVVNENSFQLRIKKKLNDIRRGNEPDVHGWNYTIK